MLFDYVLQIVKCKFYDPVCYFSWDSWHCLQTKVHWANTYTGKYLHPSPNSWAGKPVDIHLDGCHIMCSCVWPVTLTCLARFWYIWYIGLALYSCSSYHKDTPCITARHQFSYWSISARVIVLDFAKTHENKYFLFCSPS